MVIQSECKCTRSCPDSSYSIASNKQVCWNPLQPLVQLPQILFSSLLPALLCHLETFQIGGGRFTPANPQSSVELGLHSLTLLLTVSVRFPHLVEHMCDACCWILWFQISSSPWNAYHTTIGWFPRNSHSYVSGCPQSSWFHLSKTYLTRFHWQNPFARIETLSMHWYNETWRSSCLPNAGSALRGTLCSGTPSTKVSLSAYSVYRWWNRTRLQWASS